MTITLDKPLTEQTPVEIDTQLAAILNERYTVLDRLGREREHLAWSQKRLDRSETKPRRLVEDVETSESAILGYEQRLFDLNRQAEPFEDEYLSRPWTRAFLVNNSNGHVHRDMACSTCFITTRFLWLTEYSGKTETEVVEDAGERACTVCYPSAPVETLNRPTKIFTPDEKAAQAERERRAAKKEAEKEKFIFDANGEHPRDSHGYPLKTKIAARNEFSGLIKTRFAYGYDHPQDADWERTIETLRPLLVEAGFDVEKIEKTALKKAAKEKAEGEAHARAMGWIE